MDRVPFIFCQDVMGSLRATHSDYSTMATVLSGHWKAAAKSYADNLQGLVVCLYCKDDQWGYSTDVIETIHGKSLDELLELSRRFVRCISIHVNRQPYMAMFHAASSKKEIFTRLVPFITQQSRPHTLLSFADGMSEEEARMFFDLFRSAVGSPIRKLSLPYYGPESHRFLSTCVEHLEYLILDTSWPNSEAVEELVVSFLSSRDTATFEIDGDVAGSETSLKLSPKLLKTIMVLWEKGNMSYLCVSAPWHADQQEVLALPMTPEVTRREVERGNTHFFAVVWSKEDGSALSCTIDLKEHYISFRSPPRAGIVELMGV